MTKTTITATTTTRRTSYAGATGSCHSGSRTNARHACSNAGVDLNLFSNFFPFLPPAGGWFSVKQTHSARFPVKTWRWRSSPLTVGHVDRCGVPERGPLKPVDDDLSL